MSDNCVDSIALSWHRSKVSMGRVIIRKKMRCIGSHWGQLQRLWKQHLQKTNRVRSQATSSSNCYWKDAPNKVAVECTSADPSITDGCKRKAMWDLHAAWSPLANTFLQVEERQGSDGKKRPSCQNTNTELLWRKKPASKQYLPALTNQQQVGCSFWHKATVSS